MQRRRMQRILAVGLPLLTAGLVLAACSSSPSNSGSSNTTTSSAGGNLSGTLNGSGSSFQTVYMESAISAFKTVQPNMTVNYGAGGSGKGRTDLASGVVNFAGSGTGAEPASH